MVDEPREGAMVGTDKQEGRGAGTGMETRSVVDEPREGVAVADRPPTKGGGVGGQGADPQPITRGGGSGTGRERTAGGG